MMYDSISYDDGNHAEMKEKLRERILKLRETGTNKLIIDLRDNAGGSMQFVLAVAQLLAPKGGHSYIYEAVWDENTKEYKRDADGNYISGRRPDGGRRNYNIGERGDNKRGRSSDNAFIGI